MSITLTFVENTRTGRIVVTLSCKYVVHFIISKFSSVQIKSPKLFIHLIMLFTVEISNIVPNKISRNKLLVKTATLTGGLD